MCIVQATGRGKSREDIEHLCQFYRTTIIQAMITNGGFQEGRCATAVDDPCALLIDEHWGSLPALEWWQASEAHQHFLRQIEDWLEGPLTCKIYEEVS